MHNVNSITKYTFLDITGDETRWVHQGWVEAQSGLVRKIINKPGVCKGGQVVLVYDVDRIRPHSNVHQPKLWERTALFTMKGPNEVRMILEKLYNIIIGGGSMEIDKTRNIFKKKTGLCWDKYLSGDNISDHAKKKLYGMLSTVSLDFIPKVVPSQYMHKK